jgi:hypothetical protein
MVGTTDGPPRMSPQRGTVTVGTAEGPRRTSRRSGGGDGGGLHTRHHAVVVTSWTWQQTSHWSANTSGFAVTYPYTKYITSIPAAVMEVKSYHM